MESLMRLASAKLVVFHHLYPFLVNVCETRLCTPYHVYPYHQTRMHRDRSKPGLDIRIFMMVPGWMQVCSKWYPQVIYWSDDLLEHIRVMLCNNFIQRAANINNIQLGLGQMAVPGRAQPGVRLFRPGLGINIWNSWLGSEIKQT